MHAQGVLALLLAQLLPAVLLAQLRRAAPGCCTAARKHARDGAARPGAPPSVGSWSQVKQALWAGGIQRANAPEGRRSTPGMHKWEDLVRGGWG